MRTLFNSTRRCRLPSRFAFFASCLFSVMFVAASFAAGATNGFHHPGVLVNRAQLDFVRSKIATGAEPWKSAFEAAKSSALGALDYTPKPWQTCECGPRSNPDRGCKDEQRDSEAAYTQALLWHF